MFCTQRRRIFHIFSAIKIRLFFAIFPCVYPCLGRFNEKICETICEFYDWILWMNLRIFFPLSLSRNNTINAPKCNIFTLWVSTCELQKTISSNPHAAHTHMLWMNQEISTNRQVNEEMSRKIDKNKTFEKKAEKKKKRHCLKMCVKLAKGDKTNQAIEWTRILSINT